MIARWKHLLVVAAVITGCALIVVTAQQPPPAGGTTPAAGVGYTVQQAERGRVAYMSNCSGCHGPNLDDGPSDAPPVRIRYRTGHSRAVYPSLAATAGVAQMIRQSSLTCATK